MSVTAGPGDIVQSGHPPREPFPLATLAGAYDAGAVRSVHWLTAGKNDHGRVTTDGTTFFLRRSYRSKSVSSLRWQMDLLRVLRREGLPVPKALPSRDGDDVVVLDDRLYVATEVLPGGPYDPGEPTHLVAAARTLAGYHRIVAGLAVPEPEPDRKDVVEALEQRLALVAPGAAPELTARSRHLLERLRRLWPALPTTVIHGGCRRGSLLFTGSELTGVLDFDSARAAVRAFDLAIALHDLGKVYTAVGREDHKVALDLGCVERFLAAYREAGTVTHAEAEALPALLAAKRALRALGRLARVHSGAPMSVDDVTKVRLETARLAWLHEHGDEFAGICARAVPQPPASRHREDHEARRPRRER